MDAARLPAPARLSRLLGEAGFEVELSLPHRDGRPVTAGEPVRLGEVLAQLDAVDARTEVVLQQVAALTGASNASSSRR